MRTKVAAGPPIVLREAEVKAEVTAFLKRIGWKTWSTSDGRVSRNTPGLPDLWAMHAHWGTFWCEVKSETGKPSPEQLEFAKLCRSGEVGYVMGGIVQVQEHLRKIGALP